jgi:hypothetical protein
MFILVLIWADKYSYFWVTIWELNICILYYLPILSTTSVVGTRYQNSDFLIVTGLQSYDFVGSRI